MAQDILIKIALAIVAQAAGVSRDYILDAINEKKAKDADLKKAKKGVDDVRAPHKNPNAPVKEKEKHEEAKFDDFFNRFRRRN